MTRIKIYFKKAASKIAAFLFFLIVLEIAHGLNATLFQSSDSKKINFSILKKNINEKILLKKKAEAIEEINKFLEIETNKSYIFDSQEYLLKIAKTFLTKEAQDYFEVAIINGYSNTKESKKAIESCLQLEPQNLECLIYKLKLNFAEKNTKQIQTTQNQMNELIKDQKLIQWIDLTILKNNLDSNFKNRNFLKKLPEKQTEESFMMVVLEIERTFLVKNYSRSKECLAYLEKNYSDYPDLIYFKNKLNSESNENNLQNNIESKIENSSLYSAKCKNISKSILRKYRYDFNLCQRI